MTDIVLSLPVIAFAETVLDVYPSERGRLAS
jgi:hypothetical protein